MRDADAAAGSGRTLTWVGRFGVAAGAGCTTLAGSLTGLLPGPGAGTAAGGLTDTAFTGAAPLWDANSGTHTAPPAKTRPSAPAVANRTRRDLARDDHFGISDGVGS